MEKEVSIDKLISGMRDMHYKNSLELENYSTERPPLSQIKGVNDFFWIWYYEGRFTKSGLPRDIEIYHELEIITDYKDPKKIKYYTFSEEEVEKGINIENIKPDGEGDNVIEMINSYGSNFLASIVD